MPAVSRYRQQLSQSESRLTALRSTDGKFAGIRAALFGAAILTLGFSFFAETSPMVSYCGWGLMIAFVVAAILNEPIRDAIEREQDQASVTKRLLARVERDWDSLRKLSPSRVDATGLSEHQKDVAEDLDIFGKASLFQLVSMAGTTCGSRTLARWLTGAADAAQAQERSEAIEHLANQHADRHRFYSLSARIGAGTGAPDELMSWAADDPWLPKHRWLIAWMNVSTFAGILAVSILVASRFALVSPGLAQLALFGAVALVVVNVLITTLMLGPVHQIFSIAMSGRQSVSDYQTLFEAAHWLPRPSAGDHQNQLRSIRDALVEGPRSAASGLNALSRISALGSLRQSALTFLIYLPLQAIALWDVRVLRRLESWQVEFGKEVPLWFDALGELEALLSLAAIRDEYPQWRFPQWTNDDGMNRLESVALGHPLLKEGDRVCNDVSIGPSGSVLLVTGSNMSGKSTMLRSVGLNVALAASGAPVCAERLKLPSLELATSIRVRDNLAEGVSFYMAELKRLKGVVEQAQELAHRKDRVCLYLLDEILQGTNSRERLIAVTKVLERLLRLDAIGAISTHDLELASEPGLESISDIVHFRETITPDEDGNELMTFDYKMRAGVSPTTNAIRLLELVGLGDK